MRAPRFEWPVIFLILVAGLTLTFTSTPPSDIAHSSVVVSIPAPPPLPTYTDIELSKAINDAYQWTNYQRCTFATHCTIKHLLAWSPPLASAAQTHADLVASKPNCWTHESLHQCDDELDPYQRILATAYIPSAWGENAHWQRGYELDGEQVVGFFMASPPHRRTILNADFDDIGIGVTQAGQAIVVIQVFAKEQV